jgi:hypothetical protein
LCHIVSLNKPKLSAVSEIQNIRVSSGCILHGYQDTDFTVETMKVRFFLKLDSKYVQNLIFQLDQRCSFTTKEQKLNKEYLNEKIVFLCSCPGCTAFSYLTVGCLFVILVVGLAVIYRRSTRTVDSSDLFEPNRGVIQETGM